MGDKKGPGLNFYETFMLSGTAAIISKTAAAPIERVKLLLQNQDEMLKSGRLEQKYHGVIDCTKRTFQAEGVLPFWRGNVANCVRYFPTQALNFAFKEQIKVIFKQSSKDPYVVNFSKNIAAGGVGSAISLCFVYSLDFARTRLANDVIVGGEKRQYKGLFDVYVQTMKTDGIAGLYRGFVISCAGILVYRGCYFGFYDSLKPILLGKDAGFMKSFLLGYAVTIVSSLVSYPFDTVRRRMMMTTGEAVKYKSSIDCSRQILKNEGFMSMMKGAGANIIRGVACAGVLAGFDSFEAIYTKWRLSRHQS